MKFKPCSVIITFFIVLLASSARANPYQEIDRHALSAPAWAEQSVQSLVDYLVRPAQNDEEKTRAIFRWISENIAYDAKSFFSGSLRKTSPDQVLRGRTAVCDGFSGLFEVLAAEAGLQVVTISGYTKGFDYRIGKHFRGSANHAWNAVNLHGTWKLLDATWGTGYLDEKGRFVREFDDHFFLTDPEAMIYTHFPEDPKWQLLEDPISLETFEKMVYLKPAFFRYGLGLESHREGFIETDYSVTINLNSPETTALSAQLIRGTRILDDGLTFIQRRDFEQRIYAALPSPGTYTLRIFAKIKGDPGLYEWAMDYRIHAKSQSRIPVGFPEVYQPFEERECFLIGPLNGQLNAGGSYVFRIRIPGAERAVMVAGKQWVDMRWNGEWFECDTVASRGDIQVAAKFPGESEYSVILKYVAR